ncbi:MAG: PIN domain-containing protein [Acidimicrobiales bacterium]
MDFVDTNVLLYAYDASSAGRHQRARDLVGGLGRSRQGAISVQVLQEFYVNAVTRIAVPLTPEGARRRLRAFRRWPIHAPLADDVVAATVISEDNKLSFWDAMILRSAAEMGCRRLWTEDLNHGQVVAGVRIANPFMDG